ncbi:MAG: DivIVA domain-containing protein [Acutalibacteraceae bacterium]
MDKGIIKSAFFGYSKTSVCEYISSINAEFSRQLLELEKEHKKEKEELKAKLDAAEKELFEYKKAHGDIANALLEAQQYSASLKQKAADENERLVAENQRLHKEQSERLALYAASIDKLRSELSVFTADTDSKLAEYYERATDIAKEFEEA